MAPIPGLAGSYDFRKLSPEYIEKETDALISEQKKLYDEVGNLSLENVSYENVIKVSTYLSLISLFIKINNNVFLNLDISPQNLFTVNYNATKY